jgi:NitT/TauT family transport system substrate-binding protein
VSAVLAVEAPASYRRGRRPVERQEESSVFSGRPARQKPRRSPWLQVLAVVLVLLAVPLVAACGSDSSDSSSGSASSTGSSTSGADAKPVTLKVGVLPIADVAPMYVGMKQGFFSDEKLTIEPQVAEGGAAVVPAVMSGDDQIGFSNVVSLMLAKEKNLPIKPINAGVQAAASTSEAWDALLAPKGGVTDLKQLEGKTVSVNTLKNLPEVAVRNTLESAGVDPSKVKFVEIGFPDVGAALSSKRVDAAFAVEPFVGANVADGAKALGQPFEQLAPNLTIAEYFTTDKYAKENPDVVARFQRAMNKSLEYSAAHPEAVREIIPTYTKTPAAAAEKMTLPKWDTQVNADAMAKQVELSKKYGVLTGDVDVQSFTDLG